MWEHLRMFSRPCIFFLLSILAVSCASQDDYAQNEPAEVYSDLIHSDLPLFDGSSEEIWPQSFHDDNSFGCRSRVMFGDWALLDHENQVVEWFKIENYGAFHCWALVGNALEREQLDSAESRPLFFVRLDTILNRELWAFQIGTKPGSDYVLLSRAVSDDSIEEFELLQTRCPAPNVRDAGNLDILRTDYCAVNSRATLVDLAKAMALLPSLGKLSWVGDETENSE